jgi:outer membrane receptor protein involved in Fe transport
VNAAVQSQYAPARQESVLAYEAGWKAAFFDRSLQFNAAGFYYDYSNKQLFGRLLDPLGTFGVLQFLLNVPKSQAVGAEMQIAAHPVAGLSLDVGGTYVHTEVLSNFVAIDPVGNTLNYSGLPFPHTPQWNATASADYEHPVASHVNGFIGANLTYQGATEAFFNDPALVGQTLASPVLRPGVHVNPDVFKIDAFTTVDARLGVAGEDDRWRVWFWGRNILNKYYWTNVIQVLDTVGRYSGMPATYGVSATIRF